MEIYPESSPPRRDRESLVQFLEYCQRRSVESGRTQFASVSLRVKHISPLAVLQSIIDPRAAHFYMEQPSGGEAVAGAESVWQKESTGSSRFADAQSAIDTVLADTICIGDLGHGLAGPHFFFFYTFADEPEPDSPFPPGTVFLPRWQVAGSGGEYFAVANLPISPEAPLTLLAEKVLAAHAKFQAFEYSDTLQPGPLQVSILESAELGEGSYQDRVSKALEKIRAGKFHKLVLSSEPDPLNWLNQLREKYRECFSFSVSRGSGESFVGLTPELLMRTEGTMFQTEALAGSAPRGGSAGEDARHAAELLASGKDLHEHRFVAEAIVRRLAEVGVDAEVPQRPGLRALPNVQHLLSRIEGRLPEGAAFWQLLRALHPTPAVGGTPKDAVLDAIAELEEHPRGLYAGTLGWVGPDGAGQAVVAIRSALVRGREVRLYAGAGIVDGSVPEMEKRETDLKLQVLLEALR